MSMLDRFSALNRFRALFYADGGSVLSRYTTVERYCTVFHFVSNDFPWKFLLSRVTSFKLEWLYIAVDKRESLIQRYDRPITF